MIDHPLVEFIVRNPGLAETLIGEHVDDGQGYCRACALDAQRGYHSYPCSVRRMAELAHRVEQSSALPDRHEVAERADRRSSI